MRLRLETGSYAALLFVLASCASEGKHAPVSEHVVAENKPPVAIVQPAKPVSEVKKQPLTEKDWRPETYIVQKGDTLFVIAFNHGLDYHEIAALNNIQNPDLIQVGQELHLFSAKSPASKLIVKAPETKTVEKPAASSVAANTTIETVKDLKPIEISQPKVALLAYSEQALTEIKKLQQVTPKPESAVSLKEIPKRDSLPEAKPVSLPEIKPENSPETRPEATSERTVSEESMEWGLPTSGKLIGEFSESANRKGIDLSGKLGQPIVASAAGKVVYSGNGLRGYGKLVIIKHNSTFISAYAHNDQILVKEGQTVTKGQKIAEMGNSDSDQVKLHFEIRKLGKPVDPTKYLPNLKS